MDSAIFLTELVFADGTKIPLNDNSIVVLVGPNNSGKSLCLNEIATIIENGTTGKIVKQASLQKVGDDNALIDYLAPFSDKKPREYKQFYCNAHRAISEREAREIWNKPNGYIRELAEVFVEHLTTSARLADSEPTELFDATERTSGTHPFHNLYVDVNLENEVSLLFRRAFGQDLVVHRMPGRRLPIYVGKRPELKTNENVTDRSYLDKVEILDHLHTQGDGFRSFASILLRSWTGKHSVMLVDEPEAFLHPPQARLIGEMISARSPIERQFFISTHSNDIIQGLISSHPERVSVIRMERTDNGSRLTHLDNSQIRELWDDPILRYSNALNGLFHSNVVLTESDGDCRFYENIADGIAPSKDTFFTYSSGKDRIPVIWRALISLGVPVQIIADIDILQNDHPLRSIIESRGDNWADYQPRIQHFRNSLQGTKNHLSSSSLKKEINDLLADATDESIASTSKLREISRLLRRASPWDSLKTTGLRTIPSGEPTNSAASLLNDLKSVGVFVVPVGEMEGFCRTIGSHGPRWVADVLKKDLVNDPQLREARDFIGDLIQNHQSHSLGGEREVTRRVQQGNLIKLRKFSAAQAEGWFFSVVWNILAIVGLFLVIRWLLGI